MAALWRYDFKLIDSLITLCLSDAVATPALILPIDGSTLAAKFKIHFKPVLFTIPTSSFIFTCSSA